MKFKEVIIKQRMDLGLTIKELSKLIKVSPSYIIKIENDDELPSPELLKKMKAALKFDGNILKELVIEEKFNRYREKIYKEYRDYND